MRLLVVSHPAVLPTNQVVYRELARRNVDVSIVVPSSWSHEYSPRRIKPVAVDGLQGRLRPVPVALRGRPQRYFHLTMPGRIVRELKPDVAFLEAEPFAAVAAQWSSSLGRGRIPFGVQIYENIDRSLPPPVRFARSRVLRRAAFVAARSETAAALVRRWGARGLVGIVPPAVPGWTDPPKAGGDRVFTIGYAGRLVQEKGLTDLLAAVRLLEAPIELLLVGNGTLREELEDQAIPGSRVRVASGISHNDMPEAYAQMDVLVLPSRTTATWSEQFGRAVVEALWCGVPVITSDSGELPWLTTLTGGGVTFREGDIRDLRSRLEALRHDHRLRHDLAARGQNAVRRLFSVAAVADRLEHLLATAMKTPHTTEPAEARLSSFAAAQSRGTTDS